jgi:hypothetical protein
VQEQEVPKADEEVGENLPECPTTTRALLKEASPVAFLFRFANILLMLYFN